jgi:hypothetical protein
MEVAEKSKTTSRDNKIFTISNTEKKNLKKIAGR